MGLHVLDGILRDEDAPERLGQHPTLGAAERREGFNRERHHVAM